MEYKIYGLKLKDDDSIRYIGLTKKTLQERLKGHIQHSYKRNHHNACWLRKNSGNIDIILIEDNLTKEEASIKEAYYIKLYKSFGAKLTNMTSGGEYGYNRVGTPKTEEHKRKIGEKHKGKKMSEESRKKMSQSQKGNKNCVGRIYSEETKKKMSESAKNRKRKNI